MINSHDNIMLQIISLVQDCSNSSALAMELLQPCTEPSIKSILKNLSKNDQTYDEKENKLAIRNNNNLLQYNNLHIWEYTLKVDKYGVHAMIVISYYLDTKKWDSVLYLWVIIPQFTSNSLFQIQPLKTPAGNYLYIGTTGILSFYHQHIPEFFNHKGCYKVFFLNNYYFAMIRFVCTSH